jgi:hypothetical protein
MPTTLMKVSILFSIVAGILMIVLLLAAIQDVAAIREILPAPTSIPNMWIG